MTTTTTPDDPNHLGRNLGKSLTHVEAAVREQTVEKLGAWMKERERVMGDLKFLELMQFWKALYYCMWMTDKPLIQEEMGDTLATLSQNFVRPKNVENYFLAFFQTLRQEWTSIDYLRLDKFLSMIRRFLREWLMVLERTKWRGEALDRFAEVLTEEVLFQNPQPDGIRTHLAFIFLAEMHRVGGAGLSGKTIHALLTPFHRTLLHPPSTTFYKAVVEDVFLRLPGYASSSRQKSNGGEEEEEEGENKFKNLSIAEVSRRMFREAAEDETISATKRKEIYALARRLSLEMTEATTKSHGGEREDDVDDDKRPDSNIATLSGIKKIKTTGKSIMVGFVDTRIPEETAGEATAKKEKAASSSSSSSSSSIVKDNKRPSSKVEETRKESDDDDDDEGVDVESPTTKKNKKKSRLSLDSTGSQKSVRFSHVDIVPLPEVTKHMKKTKAKSASEFGASEKGILRRR